MSLNINDIVKEASQQGATDIHLIAGYPVMFRVLSSLKAMSDHILTPEDLSTLNNTLLTEKQRKEFNEK